MNADRLAFLAVIAIVAVAVIAGLVVSGSPAEQRRLRADDRRVNDIQQLSATIRRYYTESERLPPDLDTLVDGWALSGIPFDPETENEYAYEIVTDDTYRLCADFSRESRPNAPPDFWTHESGRRCYAFDYSEIVLD